MTELEKAAWQALEALYMAREHVTVYTNGPWNKVESECHAAITALRRALEQPAQQEPVVWQILNGVCHAGIRSSEYLAKEAAVIMQKTHDLDGSLAAFHVRPLYTCLQARKPLTDEQRKYVVEMWKGGNWTAGDIIDAVEAAHGIG